METVPKIFLGMIAAVVSFALFEQFRPKNALPTTAAPAAETRQPWSEVWPATGAVLQTR